MKSRNILLLVVLYAVEGKLVVRVEEMSAITVVDSSGTLLHFRCKHTQVWRSPSNNHSGANIPKCGDPLYSSNHSGANIPKCGDPLTTFGGLEKSEFQ